MAKQEIGIYLSRELGGFVAARKRQNGTLTSDAHVISEDEIISMAAILIRTYAAKTNQDTLVVQGSDGKAMMIKLVGIKAVAEALEKKKKSKKKATKEKE